MSLSSSSSMCMLCVCVRSNVFIIICMHKARARASVCVYVSVCHLNWTYHRCCRRCHGCLPPCTNYIVLHNACQVAEHHIFLYDIVLDSCAPHLLAKIAHSACQISMKYSCVCVCACVCVCVTYFIFNRVQCERASDAAAHRVNEQGCRRQVLQE